MIAWNKWSSATTRCRRSSRCPRSLNDHEKYQKTAKALREIETPVEKYRELKQVRQGLADARAMLAESDADLRAMAQEEIAALEPRAAGA